MNRTRRISNITCRLAQVYEKFLMIIIKKQRKIKEDEGFAIYAVVLAIRDKTISSDRIELGIMKIIILTDINKHTLSPIISQGPILHFLRGPIIP